MKCTEYDQLPWWKGLFTSREHYCKILHITKYIHHIDTSFLFCVVDVQCGDCREDNHIQVPTTQEALSKIEEYKSEWK